MTHWIIPRNPHPPQFFHIPDRTSRSTRRRPQPDLTGTPARNGTAFHCFAAPRAWGRHMAKDRCINRQSCTIYQTRGNLKGLARLPVSHCPCLDFPHRDRGLTDFHLKTPPHRSSRFRSRSARDAVAGMGTLFFQASPAAFGELVPGDQRLKSPSWLRARVPMSNADNAVNTAAA